MKRIRIVFSFVVLCLTVSLYSQVNGGNISVDNIAKINVDKLSDEQIRAYWERVKSEGYTLSSMETAARLRNMPELQIMKLKSRILKLGNATNSTALENEKYNGEDKRKLIEKKENASVEKDSIVVVKDENSKIFGYDFFRNNKVSFTPSENLPTPESYVIGIGDVLLVEIWGAAEGSSTHKVDNQGNISLNIIGKINVGGITFEQAKAKINSALKKIYAGISSPDGSYAKIYTGISLKEIRTINVNIIGEVKTPGTYSLSALSTVLNALYASGGPTSNGSFREIKVVRKGKQLAVYDVYKFLTTGSEDGNLSLRDQDVVIVPPYKNQVEVKGAVKREGIYEVRDGETMEDLSRYFGGFKSNAYKDNIVVERISGSKREVKEIEYSKNPKFGIIGGDKILVKELSDVFHNRISIGGEVYQPGNYAFEKGFTVNQLLNKAGGVTENAFLDRAIIFRIEKNERKSLNFSVKDIMDNKSVIELAQNDSIHVYSKVGIDKKLEVRIEGAVKTPNKFTYMEGMKVEDLVLMAGGFVEGADPSTIQVGRQVNNGDMKKVSEVYDVSLTEDLNVSANSLDLLPNDIVTVRYKKGYSKQISVQVQGEVLYPGAYVLMTKEDKISDLLKRAGGFSPYAYSSGATLVRKKTEVGEKEQEKQLKELKEVDKQLKNVDNKDNSYRVGIDLDKVLGKKGAAYDLVLNDGDIIIIPSTKQTIEVKGQVLSPSMVKFEKNKRANWYVSRAGGFANEAKKNSIYVVYPNGDIRGTERFLFFKNYPKVDPGSVVVVPERPEKVKMTTGETVSITTAVTTLAILIYNTFKK